MRTRLPDASPVLVVTADPHLLDQVLAVAAAADVHPQVVGDPAAAGAAWASAALVVVGADQAARAASLVVSRRPEVFLVGDAAWQAEVVAWSVPLAAAVVVLPEGSNHLSAAMADATRVRAGIAHLVAVLGGSGGVGASTFAAALATRAAREGRRVLLVDADPLGGGVDLLFGAERVAGWRWPTLADARGHLADLTGHLPAVDGVDVLAMSRTAGEAEPTPGAEQMTAVLRSAARSHDLVVADLPRRLDPAAREVVRRSDLVVLVVWASVRGIAATRQVLGQLEGCRAMGVIVRSHRPRGAVERDVADGLAAPVLSSVINDPAVRLAADRGDPPGRAARSGLARACQVVLDGLPTVGAA